MDLAENKQTVRWQTYKTPRRMLAHCQAIATERKLRLVGCAFCRAVWDKFSDPNSQQAIEITERYADGLATDEDIRLAQQLASDARDISCGSADWIPPHQQTLSARCTAFAAYQVTLVPTANPDPWGPVGRFLPSRRELYSQCLSEAMEWIQGVEKGRSRAVQSVQAELIRDIFGNPFRPVAADPAWRTPTVLALADAIYAERAFDRLPILADALEEAGCDHADVLSHCRGPSPHVRGCWVVDLVLGKS